MTKAKRDWGMTLLQTPVPPKIKQNKSIFSQLR
jgi:hypothetical protein